MFSFKKKYSSVEKLLLANKVKSPKTEEEENFNKEVDELIQIIEACCLEKNSTQVT